MTELESAGIIAVCIATLTALLAFLHKVFRRPRLYYNEIDIDENYSITVKNAPEGGENKVAIGRALLIKNRPWLSLTTSEHDLSVHIRSSKNICRYEVATALLKAVDPPELIRPTRELNVLFPVFPPGGKANIRVFIFKDEYDDAKPIIEAIDIIGKEAGYAKHDKGMISLS